MLGTAMPKTAVNKHGDARSTENDVGSSIYFS
jgi:hypothetical protein